MDFKFHLYKCMETNDCGMNMLSSQQPIPCLITSYIRSTRRAKKNITMAHVLLARKKRRLGKNCLLYNFNQRIRRTSILDVMSYLFSVILQYIEFPHKLVCNFLNMSSGFCVQHLITRFDYTGYVVDSAA